MSDFPFLDIRSDYNREKMKVAVITGADRGIGFHIACTLGRLGYHLFLLSRHRDALEKSASRMKAVIPPVSYQTDVGDADAVEQVINKIGEQTKRVDVLVNGAGILIPGTHDLAKEDFENMLKTNLLGSFYMIRAVIPYMKQQKSGYIMNIASRAGKTGVAPLGGYSASKFGIVGFGESLLSELASFGISVTSICPGWVATDMAFAHSSLPVADMIAPEDIAVTVEYLLSLAPNCLVREIVLECRKAVIDSARSTVRK